MSADRHAREFDVIVWGASGFTGRLVAQYLLGRYGTDGELRWAVGGRNREKLEAVLAALDVDAARVPIVTGDGTDASAMSALARRSFVVCSTAGPFARHGSELVAACARHGTHYCDITGEVQWIRKMIDAHDAAARASGARLVHCCGFDSIPSDLGTLFMHAQMRERAGSPCEEVKLRVRKVSGGFSGGTVASLLNAVEEARRDRAVRRLMGNPYGLNPAGEQRGPDAPGQRGPVFDDDLGAWTAPFIMEAVNSRVVRRTNALLAYPYGREFRYSEAVETGGGLAGWVRASTMSVATAGFVVAATLPPARAVLQRFALPQPGEGPTEAQREAGFFVLTLLGRKGDTLLRGRVTGDRDPGYGATCRMLGESAVCLALDAGELAVEGGSWTPASCMGMTLMDRLQANAGMRFELDEQR